MNFPRYCWLYSRFHGCVSFRTEQDIMILDFADMDFDPWTILKLIRYERINMNAKQPFVQALKLLFKSEAPVTVFCQNDSWTALLGNSKTIMPINETDAKFQMYATPYFVKDPSAIAEHMQGIAHATSDHIFMYKHCVLYLDNCDLPSPGGCYFDSSVQDPLYRICLLTAEPMNKALMVAAEWKSRRDVMTIPFLSKETLAIPTMIPEQTTPLPTIPEDRLIAMGSIQKRLSMQDPHCLIQDVIASYSRNNPGKDLQNLGLVIEWPFRLTFEGTRPGMSEYNEFATLSINTIRPNRTLLVRYPYDMYTEFNQVPVTHWTVVQYHPVVLVLPKDMMKVSIDSVVIGYVYLEAFYCFNHPVLEGRPTHESARNVEWILSTAKTLDCTVLETFRVDENHAINRIQRPGVPYNAWCITANDTVVYPQKRMLPKLVEGWLELFLQQFEVKPENPIDVKMVQTALTLARHKICYKTIMNDRKNATNRIHLSDDEIVLTMTKLETNFVNSVRLCTKPTTENEDQATPYKCTIL